MNPKLQIEDNKVALANLEAQLGNVSKALSMALLGGDLSAVDQAIERLRWADNAFVDWRTHVLAVLEDRREALSLPPRKQAAQPRPATPSEGGIKSQARKAPAASKTGGKKSL